MCRGGWYTFSFRYAQALTKGPSHSLPVPLSGCQCVPLRPRVHVLCWLCSEATFFCSWHGKSIDAPKVCVQICSNWGVDYPGPGISVGDRPGRMAKCMWGPSSFNSRPGWSGLCFSSALGRGIEGLKGLQGDCNPAAQTARWKVRPRAITVRAHRLDPSIQQTAD